MAYNMLRKARRKFDWIYAKRILADCKAIKGDLFCDATELLYEKKVLRYPETSTVNSGQVYAKG
jgi:hypothetical protein